jgi:hypothetical protein
VTSETRCRAFGQLGDELGERLLQLLDGGAEARVQLDDDDDVEQIVALIEILDARDLLEPRPADDELQLLGLDVFDLPALEHHEVHPHPHAREAGEVGLDLDPLDARGHARGGGHGGG